MSCRLDPVCRAVLSSPWGSQRLWEFEINEEEAHCKTPGHEALLGMCANGKGLIQPQATDSVQHTWIKYLNNSGPKYLTLTTEKIDCPSLAESKVDLSQ